AEPGPGRHHARRHPGRPSHAPDAGADEGHLRRPAAPQPAGVVDHHGPPDGWGRLPSGSSTTGGREVDMTEVEWLASENPELMVIHIVNLKGRAPAREMRLFACACCRRQWRKIPDQPCKATVEVAERFADGEISRRSLTHAATAAEQFRVGNYDDNSALHQA